MKKIKSVKLNRIEQAIVFLAEMLEDPMHDQYEIKKEVFNILGFEAPLPRRKK